MAKEPKNDDRQEEPRGFGAHTRGLSAEYAHEQGWGLEEEQRARLSTSPQATDGGTDYEYGARDFGDEPLDTKLAADAGGPTQNKAGKKEF